MVRKFLRTSLIIAGISCLLTSGMSDAYSSEESEPKFKRGAPKIVSVEKIELDEDTKCELKAKIQETSEGDKYVTDYFLEFTDADGTKSKTTYEGHHTESGYTTYEKGKL